MTELLYLHNHYLKEFDAEVVEAPDPSSLVLDKTALYPKGGGQPSDRGTLSLPSGEVLDVMDSSKGSTGVVHMLAAPLPENLLKKGGIVGQRVHGVVDWPLRYSHMRYHTALHILSGVVFHEFHSRITGGQIYPDRARLDFTLADLSKQTVDLIDSKINSIVADDREVKTFWVDAEEARARPELYRLSADLLPKGLDKLRIVEIAGFDAQLDGGTHVAKTGEVGRIAISRTENKGKDNKRIELVLDNVQASG